jgi:hypothetical protein
MNDDARRREVDRMIDDIITRPVSHGLSGDEILIVALRGLGPNDWPADEAGDRVAAGVADAFDGTELPVTRASGPVTHPRRRRLVSSRRSTRALTIAAALIVLVALAVTLRPSAGRTPTRPPRPVAVGSPKMRLVDSTSSPFQFVGAGPQTGDLICVTATTCYADQTGGASPTGSGVERTTDGGATWKPTAALPDHQQLADGPLSCPTTEMCMGATSTDGSPDASASGQLHLAVTADGGAHWRIESLTAPPSVAQASIDQLACGTAQNCVVQVVGDAVGSGTLLFTIDAGATWSAADSVAPGGSAPLFSLRCVPDGSCLGLAPTGSVQEPATEGLIAVRSVDGGRTWTSTSTTMAVGPGVILMSCADATHCLVTYPSASGGAITIATTADGGATWKVTAAAPSWPGIAISVSCATDEDCFVSAAGTTSSGGYDDPVIEATHDGGTTWAPLALPTVDGSPLALVFPLSCPVGDGCIGVGATPQEFDTPATSPPTGWVGVGPKRVIISNLPAPGRR